MANEKTPNSTEPHSGYTLSRKWFNWCFENPELIRPGHTAIYFFAIEHCNRLGWKSKFGFPTQMVMDAVGISRHSTYKTYFDDLVDWGFFELVQKSTNQYSSNVISIQSALLKSGKALDKALLKHQSKQSDSDSQSTVQGDGVSDGSIDKPLTINQEPLNHKQELELFIFGDEIFIEQLEMTYKGKDLKQAFEECYTHHSNAPNPPNEGWEWRQKLNTWLSIKGKNNGNRTGIKNGASKAGPRFSGTGYEENL